MLLCCQQRWLRRLLSLSPSLMMMLMIATVPVTFSLTQLSFFIFPLLINDGGDLFKMA